MKFLECSRNRGKDRPASQVVRLADSQIEHHRFAIANATLAMENKSRPSSAKVSLTEHYWHGLERSLPRTVKVQSNSSNTKIHVRYYTCMAKLATLFS